MLFRSGDRGLGRNRCATRVTTQEGIVGPSTLRLHPRFRRAHRGPGGYYRHRGNQGTSGRPARAHNTLQKISLRTRHSKPGEPREGSPLARDLSSRGNQALQAWRASWRVFPSARDLSSRGHQDIPPRIKPKGSARPSASRGFLPHEEGSVSATERTWVLRPPQSHGHAYAR